MFPRLTNGRRRTLAAAAVAVAAVGSAAGCSGVATDGASEGEGETFTFTLSTGAQEGTPNAAVQDWYLDAVEEATDGRVSFERTTTESLCAAPEVVECVRDGRAQIGVTVPDYTPQYFPSTSMVSIPFLTTNSQASMETLYRLHLEEGPAKAVMDQNGLHHVGTWPVGRILIGTDEQISTPEDLDGLSMRASGPIVQQLLTDSGASIQAVTASESYEAVQRGVLEAVGGTIDFPVNYGLMELLPYWSDPGIGQYSTFGMWFSQDAYDSLPEDLRATVDEVTEELNTGAGIEAFNDQAADQCQQMLDAPTVEDLTMWDESVTEAWEQESLESSKEAWVELASSQGLDDAQAVLDEYVAGYTDLEDTAYDDAILACVDEFASQ